MEVDEHLFRREAGRLVGTLTHLSGVHNSGDGEKDVVQDAFCRALEVWKFRGVPENPVGVADDHGEEPESAGYFAAGAHGADVCAGTICRLLAE